MTDIGVLVQKTLDEVFFPLGVYTFWQRKMETAGGNKDEHIVYTRDGGDDGFFADNKVLTLTKNITIYYRYDESKLDSNEGRMLVKQREQLICKTMEDAGFILVDGPFDSGTSEYAGSRRGDGFYKSEMNFEHWSVADEPARH